MEEKLRFVFEYEQGDYSMTELCERREISRETGYVWLRRYPEYGLAGLVERERAAHRHPNQTPVRTSLCPQGHVRGLLETMKRARPSTPVVLWRRQPP